MLVVKVELHSAQTRMVSDIARAEIANVGLSHERDSYIYETNCFEFNGKHKGLVSGKSVQTQYREPVLVMVARAIIAAYEGGRH